MKSMHRVRLALIGAGDRGVVYGKYALDHPDDVSFVAVADPVAIRRAQFAAAHRIPVERQFPTWEDLLAQPVWFKN
jgi:predicted dehydrogenase